MSEVRVLHVIPSVDAADGGPSVAVFSMVRALGLAGVHAEIAATGNASQLSGKLSSIGLMEKRHGCILRLFPRQTTFYKVSLPLRNWLQEHAADYDLIHIHAVFSFAPLAAAKAATRAGIPYIVRPLGVLNEWGMQNRRPWLKQLSMRFVDGPLLRRAATIHYTSEHERYEATRSGVTTRSCVIPIGIDLSAFQQMPGPDAFPARYSETRSRFRILFMSRIDAKKGIDLLLQACAQITNKIGDWSLIIAGDGEPQFVAELKCLASSLGLSKNIVWTGFLDGERKLEALATADLFVLPSYSENFGIALLEAMAVGLPCLSSDRVALARDVNDPSVVATAECDATSIANQLLRLVLDKDTRATMGANAAACVRAQFSLEAMGASLKSLYGDLISGRL